jgi:hypothetical protein
MVEITCIEDLEEFSKQSETYKKVLSHRKNCDKWGKEFCLYCFDGGLTNFSKHIEKEILKRKHD